MRPDVEVHIEQLVLDGVAADGERLARALERELGRLLAAQPLPASLTRAGGRPVVDAGAVALSGEDASDAAGVRLARAVHGAVGR